MEFSFPARVEAFREDLRNWLAEHLTDEIVSAGQRTSSDPAAFEVARRWSRTMADDAWAAVSWPVEYGGRDATLLEQMVYVEETVRARAPMPINIIGMNNIAPAIMQYGTSSQKQSLLPGMMRADEIWCQGMSEPDAGSDLASLRSRAVRDGKEFVITGQKVWTSLGHRADRCQLFVRTDPGTPGHQGISCFVIDMSLPGITARPLVTLTGDADFAEVFFDEVRVPEQALLGPLHGGWKVATTTLSHERANAARLYVEQQLRLRDLIVDSAEGGTESTAALKDSVILSRLGEAAVRADLLEILCQRSISSALAGGDSFRTASLCKSVWGELGQDIAALGFDVLGPGHADGRWLRHRLASRALTIAGGTTQINKNITARRVLGLTNR